MIELFKDLSLDRESSVPLYLQLYEQLKNMIENGFLIRDYKLPSIRLLSSHLGINLVTVVNAFKRLEEEGYIYKKLGSGSYVAGIPTTGGNAAVQPQFMSDELYQQDDLPITANGRIKVTADTIDFASATPSSELFPVEDFKNALNEVLERDKGNAFSYQEGQGYAPLRESIAQLLYRQGITAGPDSLLIISGAQQGIDIISKAMLRQGDAVITESPTYTGAAAVFKTRGAAVYDVEMKEDGPDLGILEYTLKKYRPKLIYTIPSFHNPTGFSYSDYKREAVINLAEKYNAYIIEDDYVSELSFDGKPRMPLKAIDKKGRVIFLKSFSKIFMPGLRLGFMTVPAALFGVISKAKHATDISTSGLIQRAFDIYIRNNSWDRHFNFISDIYRSRYFKITDALEHHLKPPVNFIKPGGGLNIWIGLPVGFPVDSLLFHAASEGIVFAPGRIFYSSQAPQKIYNARLSYASVKIEKIEEGIAKLCSLIEKLLLKSSGESSVPLL